MLKVDIRMPCSVVKPELPIRVFASQQAWETWLEKHSGESPGLWLRIGKKSSGIASVSYPEAVESALCYGWIDGQKKPFDAETWLQKFTPRTRKSIWSKVNCEKVEALLASKRIRAGGLLEVERAKEDGRWAAAYDSQRSISVPPDLKAALDRNPRAEAFFETLNSANRYAVLWRIQTAKKPETRARRVEKLVTMLNNHEKIHN